MTHQTKSQRTINELRIRKRKDLWCDAKDQWSDSDEDKDIVFMNLRNATALRDLLEVIFERSVSKMLRHVWKTVLAATAFTAVLVAGLLILYYHSLSLFKSSGRL